MVEVSIAIGDLKSAENTVEDILATEADNIDVLMLKAKIQVLNKKYEDAINTYKEIQNINPNYAPSSGRTRQCLSCCSRRLNGLKCFISGR